MKNFKYAKIFQIFILKFYDVSSKFCHCHFFCSLLFLMLLRRPEWRQNLFEIPKLNFNLASILLFFNSQYWKIGRKMIETIIFMLLQDEKKYHFLPSSRYQTNYLSAISANKTKKQKKKKHKSTHISFHSNPVSSKFVISQLWVVIYLKFKQGILLEKF